MADQEAKPREQDWRPIPDPTLLTTQALTVAIDAVEARMTAKIEGIFAVLEARLAGIDRATVLEHENAARVPTALQEAIGHLKDLHAERFQTFATRLDGIDQRRAEKFQAIEVQFAERDVRTEAAARAGGEAIDAALSAARETSLESTRSTNAAIAEMKATWAKQSDSQVNLLQTETRALRDQLAAQNERITRIESNAIGVQGARSDQHISTSTIISIIALIITLVGIGVTAFMRSH